jgi:DNA-binding LacI/PurR family transcriptional regulator
LYLKIVLKKDVSHSEKSTNLPLYKQLVLALRQELTEGRYAIGASLPPMRQIADRHYCSLSTVQQAYRELMAEGLLIGDSTRRVRVRAFPATSGPSGRIVCLFPKWDSLHTESFAAQFALGAGMAATAAGFAVEPLAYGATDELEPLLERLCKRPPAGVVWANPYAAEPLARLLQAGVRTVTTLRHYPEVPLPHTRDDMEGAFLHLLRGMRQRGVQRLGILAMGRDDTTSEPNLSLLRQAAFAEGIAVPLELVCRVRAAGLDLNAQRILVRDLLGKLQRGDGLYAFAPDSLELVQRIAREQGRDLFDECVLGLASIKATACPDVDFLLESDIRSHGEQAVVLIHRWLQTNMPPQHIAIPLAFRQRL